MLASTGKSKTQNLFPQASLSTNTFHKRTGSKKRAAVAPPQRGFQLNPPPSRDGVLDFERSDHGSFRLSQSSCPGLGLILYPPKSSQPAPAFRQAGFFGRGPASFFTFVLHLFPTSLFIDFYRFFSETASFLASKIKPKIVNPMYFSMIFGVSS